MKTGNLITTLFVCLAATMSAHGQTINILSFGAHADGSNATANTAVFNSVLQTYSRAKIIIPAGTYAIDNSQGALYIPNFSGELEFQGGAQMVFQSAAQGAMRFDGGTGARISGLNGTYAVVPTLRTVDMFTFTNMTDLTVEDSIAQNSPAAGFNFSLCIRPKASNITVDTTLADGLIFANSQDVVLTNYTSVNTNDNGLAFYDYAAYPDLNGATVSNVHISQVYGAHGIAVAGTSNVSISDFVIDQTAASAIWISEDAVFNTRAASNVVVQHGLVNNAGINPSTGNHYGIEYTSVDNVTFSDISITSPWGRGVSGTAPNGSIRFNNVRVSNNQSGDAWVMTQTAILEMDDCVSENSPNNGFSFDGAPMVIARNLKVIDSSAQNSLHRAIWFENGGTITASNLMVIDDRPTPVGYIIGASDGSYPQTGTIQGVVSAISGGSLAVYNYSSSVHISNVQ